MRSKKLAALAAASLLVGTTSVAAQAAPVSSVQSRAGAEMTDENGLRGGGFWAALIGLALIAALVLVIIEDDEIDLPASP